MTLNSCYVSGRASGLSNWKVWRFWFGTTKTTPVIWVFSDAGCLRYPELPLVSGAFRRWNISGFRLRHLLPLAGLSHVPGHSLYDWMFCTARFHPSSPEICLIALKFLTSRRLKALLLLARLYCLRIKKRNQNNQNILQVLLKRNSVVFYQHPKKYLERRSDNYNIS